MARAVQFAFRVSHTTLPVENPAFSSAPLPAPPVTPAHVEARAGGTPATKLVLVDRDGTLVEDVPYNGDPDRVRLVPGAREAVERLRAAGLHVVVVTNQSGVGRGLLTREQVAGVHRRIDELLGPLDGWFVCVHTPEDACGCRKPLPGLVLEACLEMRVDPADAVVVGDIGSDVDAALHAGARAILVPTAVTRPEEIERAPSVCASLLDAVDQILTSSEVAPEVRS